MRIALVLPGFSAHTNDWAIPALLNLARSLAKDHDLHVFSQRYPARGLYQFDNLTHHALGGGQKFGPASLRIWLQTARMIAAQHLKTPFDLLHAFWIDEAGFAAAIAGARLKRPVLVSLGGGELTRLPAIGYGAQRFLARRLTTRYALRWASLVSAGSRYQLELCRLHGVAQEKLKYAPLGVDTDLFQPGPPLDERKRSSQNSDRRLKEGPTLIQAASLIPVKNQAFLLETVKLVKNEMPDVRLRLAGSGPDQNQLLKLAYRLDLSHNIMWHQQVSYPDMVHLYRQSQLYLQSSHHESQGLAVLEAMACGLPVLGTPVGVLKEVACLPPQTSPAGLAGQVIELLTDEQSYLQFRQQARQTVEESFSLPVTTDNFVKIYQEAIANFTAT